MECETRTIQRCGSSAFKELRLFLSEVVKQTRFDVGGSWNGSNLKGRGFGNSPENLLTPKEFRELLDSRAWGSDAQYQSENARPIYPDELESELTAKLRELLADYINSELDLIGHKFPMPDPRLESVGWIRLGLTEQKYETKVSDFARGVVRAAAILGPDQTVGFLRDWVNTNRFHYRTSLLLFGVTTDEPLDTVQGIRVEPLKTVMADLPLSLPRGTYVSAKDYLGRAILYIDADVSQALFRPRDNRQSGDPVRINWALGTQSLESLFEALSLVLDDYVYFKLNWNDFEELSAFSGKGHGGPLDTGTMLSDRSIDGPIQYDTN